MVKRKVKDILTAIDRKIDRYGNRIFATKAAALTALTPGDRVEGLAAWIIAEKSLYRFIGGIQDTDFVDESARSIRWKVT